MKGREWGRTGCHLEESAIKEGEGVGAYSTAYPCQGDFSSAHRGENLSFKKAPTHLLHKLR